MSYKLNLTIKLTGDQSIGFDFLSVYAERLGAIPNYFDNGIYLFDHEGNEHLLTVFGIREFNQFHQGCLTYWIKNELNFRLNWSKNPTECILEFATLQSDIQLFQNLVVHANNLLFSEYSELLKRGDFSLSVALIDE